MRQAVHLIPDDLRWSQFRDEEIILSALDRTGIRWKACCEFGALDGMRFSNTAYLIRTLGWTGTFIEADAERLVRCRAWYHRFPQTTFIGSPVTAENVNQLVPEQLDFLSIDVDGNDYWIWKALQPRPSVVCIEYNHDLQTADQMRGYDAAFVRQQGDHGYGAPKSALVELAESKGYSLFGDDGQANLIFYDRIKS